MNGVTGPAWKSGHQPYVADRCAFVGPLSAPLIKEKLCPWKRTSALPRFVFVQRTKQIDVYSERERRPVRLDPAHVERRDPTSMEPTSTDREDRIGDGLERSRYLMGCVPSETINRDNAHRA